MNRFWTVLVAGLLLSGCMASLGTDNPKKLHFAPLQFELPRVEHFRLANGVQVFLRADHELPLVSCTAMLAAGGVDEPSGKSGLARLHAAAMRSAGAGETDAEVLDGTLEGMAADLTAGSDAYATTVELSVQRSDLESGLGILCDVLRRPRFDTERVELTRRRMLESIRRQADRPGLIAHKALVAALYRGHPLGDLPTLTSVSAILPDDLEAFHRRYFQPDNLWLAVSGDIDRATLEPLLIRLLGDWQGKARRVGMYPPLPAEGSPAVLLGRKTLPQTTVLMGSRGIDKSDPDLYALRVLNFILGGGNFNSRLMQNIRTRRGLAYSVYSHFQVGRHLPGLFIAAAETKNGSASEVVRLMRNEMETLTRQPVTEEELALAKDSLVNSFVFAFEDTHEIARQTMRLAFYGYPADYLARYRQRLASVTVEQVLAAARRHLDPAEQTIVLVGAPSQPQKLASDLNLPLSRIDADAEEYTP